MDVNVHIWRSHRILLDLNASQNLVSWKYWISSHSKNQPSWLSFNQTSKLDIHPGCHSIKPLNWTAILAVTQSNQSVYPGGWQADLKGGSGGGGRQPPRKDQLTAATAASQQLWTSGGALFQRAQERNIPFGESFTSTIKHFVSVNNQDYD